MFVREVEKKKISFSDFGSFTESLCDVDETIKFSYLRNYNNTSFTCFKGMWRENKWERILKHVKCYTNVRHYND